MTKRILLAEDTPDSAHLFALMLRNLATIEIAHDGVEALEMYRTREPYHLLLLDVSMPHVNGFEVAEAVRKGGDDSTPIVMLTAYAEPETIGRATRSNSVVWAKPIDPDELERRVAEILNV